MPAVLVLAVLVLVAVLAYVRRLARLGALQLVKDVCTSIVSLGRWIYFAGRSVVRLVRAEARSW
jgi:hypothetical protein